MGLYALDLNPLATVWVQLVTELSPRESKVPYMATTTSTSNNSTMTLGSQDIQVIVAGISTNPAALASMANYMLSQLPPARTVSSISKAVSSSSASG